MYQSLPQRCGGLSRDLFAAANASSQGLPKGQAAVVEQNSSRSPRPVDRSEHFRDLGRRFDLFAPSRKQPAGSGYSALKR
jgi:hypothetical protein